MPSLIATATHARVFAADLLQEQQSAGGQLNGRRAQRQVASGRRVAGTFTALSA
jgi:hypothetical protein